MPVSYTHLDVYKRQALPPSGDPLDEEAVNQYVLDSLEAMHIPKEVLARIDFNLDVLDEAQVPVPIAGLDTDCLLYTSTLRSHC